MVLDFTLTGLTPLLMHKNDIDERDRLQAWRKNPANKNLSVPGDDRTPAWTWHTAVYHDGEYLVMPSDNIMVALRQAGAKIILKKQKTMKEISQSGLMIVDEFCKLLVNGKQITSQSVFGMEDKDFKYQANAVRGMGFRLWAKPCRIGTSSHIRVRPRFDNWAVQGKVQVLAPELTEEVVSQLFELAGRVGLGSWRPGGRTPGRFGMFSAVVK